MVLPFPGGNKYRSHKDRRDVCLINNQPHLSECMNYKSFFACCIVLKIVYPVRYSVNIFSTSIFQIVNMRFSNGVVKMIGDDIGDGGLT